MTGLPRQKIFVKIPTARYFRGGLSVSPFFGPDAIGGRSGS
jgi:hypothetical protein